MFDIYKAIKLPAANKGLTTIKVLDTTAIVSQVEITDQLARVLLNVQVDNVEAREIESVMNNHNVIS